MEILFSTLFLMFCLTIDIRLLQKQQIRQNHPLNYSKNIKNFFFKKSLGSPGRAPAHNCLGKAYAINNHGTKGHIAASQG